MRKLMRVFLLFVILATISANIYAQSLNCWPNSRGNALLQGVTPVNLSERPQLKWLFDAEGIFKSAPVVCNGKVLAGSTNGTMYCLNLQGDSVWGVKTDNAIEAPALIHDGAAYFGNLSGAFFAVDMNTGDEIWQYKTDNQIMGAPAFYEKNDKKIIVVGSYDYYLHGIDARTGKNIWKYESDNFLNGAPAIYNGQAIFGGCDGFLHIVDIENGNLIRKVDVGTYVAASPAVHNGIAYVGDYESGFTCVDIDKGEILWRFENEDGTLPFLGSPAYINGKIIIGNRDKFLYCFNAEDGKLLWKTNTGNRIDGSAVIDKQNALVVNMRGDVNLINHENGEIVWTYQLGSGVMKSPAVIEGRIFLASTDGNLYCLGK
ncbi:MAG TPA: PQQ-binding-like beta-propeller repeat protein [Prolixibacteraceae bacterium]|nr:PQQ-binding-like beta-propeller repeat protein [Prolixibacteraceae bacterium]